MPCRIIRATYKTDRYENWLKRNKIEKAELEGAVGATSEVGEECETVEVLPDKKKDKEPERFKGKKFLGRQDW